MIAVYGLGLMVFGFIMAMILPKVQSKGFHIEELPIMAPLVVGAIMFVVSAIGSIGMWMWSNML